MTDTINYTIAIPARNEEGSIAGTVSNLVRQFNSFSDVEILVIDNLSSDGTRDLLCDLSARFDRVRWEQSEPRPGYGVAVKSAIDQALGDYIVFVMADGSESPSDVSRFIQASKDNPDASVFGNRFGSESEIVGYPAIKLIANRLANSFLKLLVRRDLPDLTNGFKLFKVSDLRGLPAPLPDDFSITVALSVGVANLRGPIVTIEHSWFGRDFGISKFRFAKLIFPYLRAALRALRNP